MEEYLPLIIQLVSGAAGGNIAGSLLKKFSLGAVGNSIAGILGGFGGGKILDMLTGAEGSGDAAAAAAEAVTSSGMDMSSILGSVGGGAVGGGLITTIVGAVKGMMNKG